MNCKYYPKYVFFQILQETMKECSVNIKRLSEPIIKKSIVKVEDITIEDHDDLNADIYNDSVSSSLKLLF